MNRFPQLACPDCRAALQIGANHATCPACHASFAQNGSIWRFVAPDPALAAFADHYERVRSAEGWGSADPVYHRQLPFAPTNDPNAQLWRLRAHSWKTLLQRSIRPAEARGQSLRVLDLGAGSGWLAAQLSARGHQCAAVDLRTEPHDGLGALPSYAPQVVALAARFEQLPLAAAQADRIIFNAAFHYAPDLRATLREALRCLAPHGQIAILDSPLYRDPASGAAMIAEREQAHQAHYGARGESLGAVGFLVQGELAACAAALGLRLRTWPVPHGWRRRLAPLLASLSGRREPAQMPLIILEAA